MAYINDKIEDLRDFRGSNPEDWRLFWVFMGERFPYTKSWQEIINFCMDSKSVAEALRKMEAAGMEVSRDDVNRIIRRTGQRIVQYHYYHPPKKVAMLTEDMMAFLEKSTNGFLRQFGVEMAGKDYFRFVSVRRLDGRLFSDGKTLILKAEQAVCTVEPPKIYRRDSDWQKSKQVQEKHGREDRR